MPTKSKRNRAKRSDIAAAVLKPTLQWNTARFSVISSFIDPCCPIDEFHTDDTEEARRHFMREKARMRKHSGEWSVVWWEHPDEVKPTRKVIRYYPRGWIYYIEFPRSSALKRYDYMEASRDNAKKYETRPV